MRPSRWLGAFIMLQAAFAPCVAAHAVIRNPRSKIQNLGTTIYLSHDAGYLERLAAQEVRRYVYLRTGKLLPIASPENRSNGGPVSIVVTERSRPMVRNLARRLGWSRQVGSLKPQGYLIRSDPKRRVLLIAGGDAVGTLYGAYRFAETLGVRFYLHGDTIPDARIPLAIPDLNETGAPLFALRGIQPFHDFPEGPDWWSVNDYRAIVEQLPKLRMNFLGLHTYPEPIAEPTVWIGRTSDLASDGQVLASYPSSYQNTLRGDWGYAPRPTGEFLFGASALFDRDAFGANVMRELCPKPAAADACNNLFTRTGTMLQDVFSEAQQLGIKTCVGTETPLTIPKEVRDRLIAAGDDPSSAAVVTKLYEGIFRRITATYPIDYYWLWTPEGWTWEGTREEQVRKTVEDLGAALAAAKNVSAPFDLATCGWVLGPPGDRALFDRNLPKTAPISCINRQVGNEPVDPAFAKITGRPKWAIPWLEDDPGLSAPQLWAGRMRRDAADALKYGCTGLMGIHWRTRVLGPNIGALAAAGWDQRGWSKPSTEDGPVGGTAAAFDGHSIAGTGTPEIYRSVRYGMSAYRFRLPDGRYRVTLRFCEPHYGEAGKRVFSVAIDGRSVIRDLDIFAKVGRDRALDYAFDDIAVTGGMLKIDFLPVVEFPSIAAISIEGAAKTVKVNCGGPACGDYAADPAPWQGYLPAGGFYRDWATQEFGKGVGERVGRIFERLDGRLPRPVDWTDGPGGLRPDDRSWDKVSPEYAFVSELEALSPRVTGPADRERFGYWLSTMRYLRATARTRCLWGNLERSLAATKSATDPAAKRERAVRELLPAYRELVKGVEEVYSNLLSTVTTTGELGTIANWEQHIRPVLLDKNTREIEGLLGRELSMEERPHLTYQGPVRLIVMPPRSHVDAGESLDLDVRVLSPARVTDATVLWRPLGSGPFLSRPLRNAARGVYTARLTGLTGDVDYYIRIRTEDGRRAVWPASATGLPQTCQTLVVTHVRTGGWRVANQ